MIGAICTDQGHALAQYNLGARYETGRHVPLDFTQAVTWYRKVADQGLAAAQDILGFMYFNGQGVPQDFTQAVAWYRKAADQGLAAAQYNLSLRYTGGQGVPRDYVEAYKWLDLAAAHASAADRSAYVDSRDALAKNMTPQQLAEARTRAADWRVAFERRRN